MLIAILNQSTLVSNADTTTMTQAIAAQVRLDVAPLWDRAPAAVIFYTNPEDVPATAHGIALVDTIKDQPKGVLGFHTEDQGGKLWGVVAAKPVGQRREGDDGGLERFQRLVARSARDVHRPQLQPVGQRRAREGVQASRCATRSRPRPMRSTASRCPTS